MCHMNKDVVHFCCLLVLPSLNAGTLAQWCKGACITGRIVFVQERRPSSTKQSLAAFSLQNAAHVERGNNKEK